MTTTMFLGEIRFRVTGCESDEAFEAHIDQVIDYLYEDDRVVDPDYTASLAERTVEFALSVEGDDDTEAYTVILGALRAAIHAAEGCTPGWESHFKQVLASIRDAQLVDA